MAPSEQRPGIRPRASLGRQLDIAARASFPACATALLMLLTQVPADLGNQAALLPAVTLCCVWFWSLFRPATMPAPVVFLLGIVMDLLGFLPLGVSVLTLLGVHGAALALRRFLFGRGFGMIWLVFAAVALIAALMIWLLVVLLSLRLLSPDPALFIAVLAVALFPVLVVPFSAAHRSIADPAQA